MSTQTLAIQNHSNQNPQKSNQKLTKRDYCNLDLSYLDSSWRLMLITLTLTVATSQICHVKIDTCFP